jgi:putative endonuclease
MNTRAKGKEGEDLVREHYRQQGYTLIEQNFTIKGGEIDLLMKKEKLLVAIEVKNLDTVQELDDYITAKKV